MNMEDYLGRMRIPRFYLMRQGENASGYISLEHPEVQVQVGEDKHLITKDNYPVEYIVLLKLIHGSPDSTLLSLLQVAQKEHGFPSREEAVHVPEQKELGKNNPYTEAQCLLRNSVDSLVERFIPMRAVIQDTVGVRLTPHSSSSLAAGYHHDHHQYVDYAAAVKLRTDADVLRNHITVIKAIPDEQNQRPDIFRRYFSASQGTMK